MNSPAKSKAETLIGFAVKARKTVFGADFIGRSRGVALIICCPTLSERTFKQIAPLKEPHRPVIVCDKPLEEIVFKKNTKVMGITDKQMARAIMADLPLGYKII